MSLKLSSGFCRGLTLEDPALNTRPTPGRVRSAVWNSLQDRLLDAKILDVCAGSGAVGIEALSRGAARAVFIEKDKSALLALGRNLLEVKKRASKQNLNITVEVMGRNAVEALPQCLALSFDIIWLDPPFAQTCQILAQLKDELHRLLHVEGILLIESSSSDLPEIALLFAEGGWTLKQQKSYGKIGVSYLCPLVIAPAQT